MFEELKERINKKEAVYAVIGMGYVGLPLAVAAAQAGITVYGFDVDETKIELLRQGRTYITDISDQEIKEVVESGKLIPSSDESVLNRADVISICVPTPLNKNRDPDMRYIIAAAEAIKRNMRRGQLVILESTTYPGTTREILLPIITNNGFEAGKDVFLAFSPERIDPGNPKWNIKNTPKVVGGISEKCTDLAATFYSLFIEKIHKVSSPESAEMTKLLENIFRAVNIALVNELMLLGDRMGINIWEVVEAAATKPFGFMKFYPGPGLGGHCIPIDPFYLSWKAKEYDYWTEFIELAGRISENIPRYVVQKAYRALSSVKKPLQGSKILVLGLAYKKDIGDLRHSPAIKVVKQLSEEGAVVLANDPHVSDTDFESEFSFPNVRRVDLDDEVLSSSDLVILLADHSIYDYERIAGKASLILDTRNAFGALRGKYREKIWLL